MTDAHDLLVVGIGASAGGVTALKEFFARVPAHSGVAYVAILHLSPDHDSHLAEVLQTSSPIPVVQVQERVPVAPDHAYVISPNRRFTMVDGFLDVAPLTGAEERRVPVDMFFRALAEARGSHAACVVLTGTGADGSSGLKRIKERGGVCFVQDPAEAEHDDMPRHAIATGLVDSILPVAEIPARVAAYRRALADVSASELDSERLDSDEHALREVFTQLRARTGHDFSHYERSTVRRRVERRIAIHDLPDLAAYAGFLRDTPEEAHRSLRDLLVSVTHFFRDRETFDALEQHIIPRIFERKGPDDHVRIWVPACATGEEAYSIVMLCCEFAAERRNGPAIQVFATDLDDSALAAAREALYTEADTADVPADRLARFFTREGELFRVRKDLRENVLFARHDVLKDPPFSHLDLVSCRNLFTYLNRSTRQRVSELLHFALRPGGFLLLGAAESVEATHLFTPLEQLPNLYQRRDVTIRPFRFLPGTPSAASPDVGSPTSTDTAPNHDRWSMSDLHQRLLEQYAPPSVVVNEGHEILHLSERAGRYLQFAGGELSTNLLNVVRDELRIDLRAALEEAAQTRRPVSAVKLPVHMDDQTIDVTLHVRPALRDTDPARGVFLVVFEEDGAGDPEASQAHTTITSDDAVRQLESELVRLKAHLRGTIEQHEVQSEELKASNEELQSMNEELRSTAEELETSKEELQSLNEELTTVNDELKHKVEEQAQANNDIQNLVHSTGMAAIFLDRRMRIKLFTPRARELFNLIPTDRGRPLSDINSGVPYDQLARDVDHVLQHLERVQREIETRDGRSYLLHLVPYRTLQEQVDGVVLSFVDISERKQFEAQLRRNEEHLRLVLGSIAEHAIIALDASGMIVDWNVGAEHTFGFSRAEAVGQSAALIFTPEDRARGAHVEEMRVARATGRAADERWHVRKDGSRLFVSGVLSPIGGHPVTGYVKVARDLTERKQHEESLKRAHDLLEQRVVERTRELASQLKERQRAEEQVRRLLSRVMTVQEEERRRIARDLHDDLGQKMTALHLKLAALCRSTAGLGVAEEHAREAQAWVQQLDRDLDFFTWELRPAALYDLGLNQALRDFVAQWTKNFGIATEYEAIGVEAERWRTDIEVNLYRIAQEALNNVHKHAHATKVDLVLQKRGAEIVLSIEDNGVGFDPAITFDGADRGMGLIGMRERAALVDGTLQIERANSGGTAIIVRVPAAAPDGPMLHPSHGDH